MRGSDGTFRAFVKASRHRGSQLAAPGRGTTRRFVCPFHGWTYTTNGELAGVSAPDQFGPVDRDCMGLVELPAVERYGRIDVPDLLGGLAEEFESWHVGRHVFSGECRLDKRMNWKLANDTFGETYHFNRPHRDTLGRLSHGDVIAYETFGRNHRAVLEDIHGRLNHKLLKRKKLARYPNTTVTSSVSRYSRISRILPSFTVKIMQYVLL